MKFLRCSLAEKKRVIIIIYQHAHKNFFAQYHMKKILYRSENCTVVKE